MSIVCESSPLISVAIRCFSSARSIGRTRTNTLSFPFPHWKKSQSVKSELLGGLWVSSRLIQSVSEEDIHRGNLAHWPTSVVVHPPIGR
ncbi:hypothetical protein TNCV_2305211 [Trichonephila clavipes]|nr:hypothetical protein TNCV_2305211 [Trichonephila clavipes]